MILADTMVWADHFGKHDARLASLVASDQVRMHPYVRGELALGNLPRRHAILRDLDALPAAPLADHQEVAGLIESARLYGTGLGYVDAHLLASTLLLRGGKLWSRDKRLSAVAVRLGVGYDPAPS